MFRCAVPMLLPTPPSTTSNHLGAPVVMTNKNAQPVWSAEYVPFGKRIAGQSNAGIVKTVAPGHVPQAGVQGIQLDLRLPGQWEDAESGLYYNDQRYYDPDKGRYLSPDPLGLHGGLNAYAYVNNNPVGFSDPLGLVLFAFDGTANTNDEGWLRENGSSLSNVWQFRRLYEDGNARYITGVGTIDRSDPARPIDPVSFKPGYVLLSAVAADSAFNYSGPARIARMIEYFNSEADLATDDSKAMDVDIIGFSRGAAQARDFANQIVAHTKDGIYSYSITRSDGTTEMKCQKVNFRFMGLWDTVLSTNHARAYNLAIPEQFSYVAQAAALNEYRGNAVHPYLSFGAFPLESIMDGMSSPVPVPGKTRIERGFIGAHADIGGGFGADENQLSQVALVWMVRQATAAEVTMSAPPSTITANPVIHDKSDSILTGRPAPRTEDREVRYVGGSKTHMRSMPVAAGMSYADTLEFIDYLPADDPRRSHFVTGTVDMQGYLEWLNKNDYGLDELTVH